ncbi:MAG: hypothetical protein PHAS_01940 [Phascolarctobacterium sp.]
MFISFGGKRRGAYVYFVSILNLGFVVPIKLFLEKSLAKNLPRGWKFGLRFTRCPRSGKLGIAG